MSHITVADTGRILVQSQTAASHEVTTLESSSASLGRLRRCPRPSQREKITDADLNRSFAFLKVPEKERARVRRTFIDNH